MQSRAVSDKVARHNQREKILKEHKAFLKKLRDPLFRKKAVQFTAKEIHEHYSGDVDLVVGGRRLKFFLDLAKKLGKNTCFKTLRASLRLDQGQKILHVQEIAFSKSCLEEVRGKIIHRKHAPTSRQLVPIAISIISSRSAIEIEGSPVVSLNHGCPCCRKS